MLYDLYLELYYLTMNVSIVCHRYEVNDELVKDYLVGNENVVVVVVVVEINDLKVMDDVQPNDLNMIHVVVVAAAVEEVIAIGNVLMEVVVVEDDDVMDDDDIDEMDDQDGEVRPKVSIVKWSSLASNAMMIEAKYE